MLLDILFFHYDCNNIFFFFLNLGCPDQRSVDMRTSTNSMGMALRGLELVIIEKYTQSRTTWATPQGYNNIAFNRGTLLILFFDTKYSQKTTYYTLSNSFYFSVVHVIPSICYYYYFFMEHIFHKIILNIYFDHIHIMCLYRVFPVHCTPYTLIIYKAEDISVKI